MVSANKKTHRHSHRPVKAANVEWAEKDPEIVPATVKDALRQAMQLEEVAMSKYDLNPHGATSFGKAVEECQGGIHYVLGRYNSATVAKKFWQDHHWY